MRCFNAKKQLFTILLIVFLGFLGTSMPYLIFPALFLNPHYSIMPETWNTASHSLFLGVTLAAYPLGQFLGSPIIGALSDDHGRKPILTGTLLIAAVSNLITGAALEWKMLGLLIFSRFVAGVMEGNLAIARALAADLKTIPKHETFGKISAVASIAYLLGPLLGGLLADISLFNGLSTATPFYLIGVLSFSLAFLSATVLKDYQSALPKKKKSLLSQLNILKRVSHLFQNKRLRFLMSASTFFTLAVDIFYEFSPVYLTSKWMLTPIQMVLYNGVLCIALAFGNGWFPSFFSKRYSNKYGIIGAMGSLTLILLGIILTSQSIPMLLFFALSGLTIGLGVTLITVSISDSAPNNIQGEIMGVQISLRFLGDGIICLLGGVLLLFSSKLILLIAAFISGLTALYYARNLNRVFDYEREE